MSQGDKLAADRIYLPPGLGSGTRWPRIDNGISLRLYIRPNVDQEMLYQVPLALLHHAGQCRTRFGAETLQDVAVILSAPEDYAESLGEEARRILACAQQIRRERWRRV